MEIHKVHSVFSALILRFPVGKEGHPADPDIDVQSCFVFFRAEPGLRLGRDELLVVGVPSYSGRVPDTCHCVGEPHKDR